MALVQLAEVRKDPFAAYGINHLSPSTLNTYVSSPALFVLQKCFGRSTPVGCAAHRGTAVEDGIAHGLLNPQAPVEVCVKIAQDKFNTLSALTTDPGKDKELAGIPGMVAQGLTELRPYGVPSALQGRVEIPVPGCAVPLMGFFDFYWEQHGVGVDLKTTHAVPSSIKLQHARQVSLYKTALEAKEFRVSYTSSKKVSTYLLESDAEHMEVNFRICRAIQNLLAISPDPQVLASFLMPDVDSFFFNDSLARRNALEVFGI